MRDQPVEWPMFEARRKRGCHVDYGVLKWRIRPAQAAAPPGRRAPIQRLARLHSRDQTIRHNRKTTDAVDNDQTALVASGNAVEAHNLTVAGSNPPPATKFPESLQWISPLRAGFPLCPSRSFTPLAANCYAITSLYSCRLSDVTIRSNFFLGPKWDQNFWRGMTIRLVAHDQFRFTAVT
jgi:hypothetical protein